MIRCTRCTRGATGTILHEGQPFHPYCLRRHLAARKVRPRCRYCKKTMLSGATNDYHVKCRDLSEPAGSAHAGNRIDKIPESVDPTRRVRIARLQVLASQGMPLFRGRGQ